MSAKTDHEEKRGTIDPEELVVRNILQFADAKRYQSFACAVLGKEEISDEELFIWYVEIGLAAIFKLEWQIGESPSNMWFTGVKRNHPPNKTEAWKHLRDFLDGIKIPA